MALSKAGISTKQIALIHVARAKCGMTEDDYRSVLHGVGVSSSKELNPAQFEEVLRRFSAWGFEPRSGVAAQRQSEAESRGGSGHGSRVMAEIEATLRRLKLTAGYADGIARQMFGVERLAWLREDQAFKVLQALKVYTKRLGKKGQKGRKGQKGPEGPGKGVEHEKAGLETVASERKNGTDEA